LLDHAPPKLTGSAEIAMNDPIAPTDLTMGDDDEAGSRE